MGLVLFFLSLALLSHPDGMRFEGAVGVEGSEPMTVLVLYLEGGEKLVLDLDPADRAAIQNNLPGRIEVIGTVSERKTHLGMERFLKVEVWHWINKEED